MSLVQLSVVDLATNPLVKRIPLACNSLHDVSPPFCSHSGVRLNTLQLFWSHLGASTPPVFNVLYLSCTGGLVLLI
jgi:hypothetical protein